MKTVYLLEDIIYNVSHLMKSFIPRTLQWNCSGIALVFGYLDDLVICPITMRFHCLWPMQIIPLWRFKVGGYDQLYTHSVSPVIWFDFIAIFHTKCAPSLRKIEPA